jgi:prepilin-type N-terminal cleavage/methylation domain-containing protein
MKGEKGFSLIEVLVSLALLGIISVGFLSSLGTASAVTITTDKQETARNLAETQMEYVKSQAYDTSYATAPIPDEYGGYTATIDVETLHDSNIQKITVTIERHGEEVTTLEGYKVR